MLCHPQDPMCLSFWLKVTNLSHNDPNVFDFLIKKQQFCSKNTKFFTNFHPNLWQNFVSNFWKDLLFCVKFSLLTCYSRPIVFVIFASPNAPYFENWGRTPTSVLCSSDPGDLNKYLDDIFAITSPDPILFGPARLCVTHNALRGYCTPGQFLDCFNIFLKNYNTLVTSKICFL